MCGRYTLAIPSIVVEKRFQVILDKDSYRARFNAAPGQALPIITNRKPGQLQYFHWGFLPHWAKDPKIAFRMINARAETILEKVSFRNAMQYQRCIIPADSYYEWQKIGLEKQAFRILMQDKSPFAMAGLWSIWHDAGGRAIKSFSIITVPANALASEIHNRMPAILQKQNEQAWLNPDLPAKEAFKLLQAYPAINMQAYPVSGKVNNARYDNAELIEPLQ